MPSRAYLCKDNYQEAVINSVPVCLESLFQALSVFMWTYLPDILALFANRSFNPTSFFPPFEAKIPKAGLRLYRVLRKEQSQGQEKYSRHTGYDYFVVSVQGQTFLLERTIIRVHVRLCMTFTKAIVWILS